MVDETKNSKKRSLQTQQPAKLADFSLHKVQRLQPMKESDQS